MKLAPIATNMCFGCGGANDRGMQLEFEADETTKRIRGNFRLAAEYQGGAGYLHGGIIALLMDEAMGKLTRFRDVRAVTAELTVEYLKPIPVEQDITIEAFETDAKGRNLFYSSEIRNAIGDLLARGRGRFVAVQQRT
jgi:uncharacterized protein (TIGR00369 family)